MKPKTVLCRGAVFLFMILAVVFAGSQSSHAVLLTGVDVKYFTPTYQNYYGIYQFKANELGSSYLTAFCVDPQALQKPYDYELVSLPSDSYRSGIEKAAKMADFFFHNLNTKQIDFQIAIWDAIGFITYSGTDETIKGIISKDWNSYKLIGPISLAKSSGSQDYLLKAPVPEPATMLLLGLGLIGIAGFSRRRFH